MILEAFKPLKLLEATRIKQKLSLRRRAGIKFRSFRQVALVRILIQLTSERGLPQLRRETPALTNEQTFPWASSRRVQWIHRRNILREHPRRIEERGAEPLHEMKPRAPHALAFLR
jgi:hypothetical protein